MLSVQGATLALTARSGERFAANVLPLLSGRRLDAARRYSSVAAVFVRSTAVNFPRPIQVVSDLHHLTAGETRVLFLILEVNGVAATATMLGVSEATVKTHLRSIFRKTGARNIKLASNTGRHGLQTIVQDIDLRVPDRAADRGSATLQINVAQRL